MREILAREIVRVSCNRCGNEIDTAKNDFFSGEKEWGYRSEFDGENHSFELCEYCYNKVIGKFKIRPLAKLDGIR